MFSMRHTPSTSRAAGDYGDGGILRAADVNFSKKRLSAVDHIFCQSYNPLFLSAAAVSGINWYPRAGKFTGPVNTI